MPYKDPDLKKKYQQRTATPAMRAWRNKNREHHRKYIREWKRKQYANPEKRKRILERNKLRSGYKPFLEKVKKRWKEVYIKELKDLYVVGLLVRRSGLTRQMVYDCPELIDLQRKIVIIKRKLKEHDNNSNKLIRYEASLKRKSTWLINGEKKAANCKRG